MNRTLKKLRKRYRSILQQNPVMIQPVTSENCSDPWRCEVCGSRNVCYRSWIGSDDNILPFDGDLSDTWCEDCQQHTYQYRESDLMNDSINPWWDNETSVEDREKMTGLAQKDFDPQEGYRAFREACDRWWNTKTNEEKIEVWRLATRSES